MAATGNGKAAPVAAPPAPRTIRVEVDPAANWQRTFRDAVSLAARHKGPDQLTLVLSGKKLAMALPDYRVALDGTLQAALAELPGVVRVGS
jgi:hypothetical protein